jgi:hypothetical protein
MVKKLIAVCSIAALLAGCAATQTMISKRNLDVQTKMSNTVFLNPVEDSQKTVYVQVKNTSDKPQFKIDSKIRTALESKGYQVVSSLNKAHYLLQANILQVGKVDPSAAEKMFLGGFGSNLGAAAMGAGVGTTVGLLSGGSGRSMLTGGLIGGAIAGIGSTIANAAVKDVTYTVITDLQISEKAGKGARIQQTEESNLAQGTSSSTKQVASSQAGWMRYQTRIMSTANKVNLKFENALPLLEKGLADSISGIF